LLTKEDEEEAANCKEHEEEAANCMGPKEKT
jgi:hypothetical protein